MRHSEQLLVIIGGEGGMVSASQIRNELAFYIAGVISLKAFEDWFVVETWNVASSGSKAAEIVTFEIEGALSEYTSGYISEARLRQLLTDVIHGETQDVTVRDPRAVSQQPRLWLHSASPVRFAEIPAQL